jgi:hypothetical protein
MTPTLLAISRTSAATTENPSPWVPARALSIMAFSASMRSSPVTFWMPSILSAAVARMALVRAMSSESVTLVSRPASLLAAVVCDEEDMAHP